MRMLTRWFLGLTAFALFAAIIADTITPPKAFAASMISNSTHLSVCRAVYGGRFSFVKQLDPKSFGRTSLALTATLCDGYAPVLGVDLSARACSGRMIVPMYIPVPWWKFWVKPEFLGWGCA